MAAAAARTRPSPAATADESGTGQAAPLGKALRVSPSPSASPLRSPSRGRLQRRMARAPQQPPAAALGGRLAQITAVVHPRVLRAGLMDAIAAVVAKEGGRSRVAGAETAAMVRPGSRRARPAAQRAVATAHSGAVFHSFVPCLLLPAAAARRPCRPRQQRRAAPYLLCSTLMAQKRDQFFAGRSFHRRRNWRHRRRHHRGLRARRLRVPSAQAARLAHEPAGAAAAAAGSLGWGCRGRSACRSRQC